MNKELSWTCQALHIPTAEQNSLVQEMQGAHSPADTPVTHCGWESKPPGICEFH